jgi:4-hydroxythreonine-4-phosphate dehydrogenase
MGKDLNDNSIERQPVIGVTMGDPAGIGPEIVVKALADPDIRKSARFIIFGMNEQLSYAADMAEIEPFWGRYQHEKITRDFPCKVVLADYDDYAIPPWMSQPSSSAGAASLKFCTDAIEAARNNIVDGVVTAPINKTSWKLAGAKWPGHTELLADLCKSKRKVMMFVAGKLKIALATIHEALFDVQNSFTIGAVYEPIDLLDRALKTYFDISNPKIAVAALNPHAGENGRFGDEERRIITPAIQLARRNKIDARGPFPADSVFVRASKGEFDAIVAMYHDQAMIPVKLLAFDSAVNVTIGIPIIRTSPAHGTAFEIAGKNKADASSMKSAVRTAVQMALTKNTFQMADAH